MIQYKLGLAGAVAAWVTFLLAYDARAAALLPGDIYINVFTSDMPLQRYRPNGAFVRFYGSQGNSWEGATISRDGLLATTRRLPVPGVSLFDADTGNETMFNTPQVGVPGDVSFFADGTLAVSDQEGDVDLYSRTGAHLGTLSHPALGATPFGNTVAPDDTLWVASFAGGVSHFARDGTFLGSFAPFSVADLGVDPVDGTLWIPQSTGVVQHYTPSGVELGMFPTAVVLGPGNHMTIAVAIDRTLYVSSSLSDAIYHYTPEGALLGTIALPTAGRPLFMSVAVVPEPSGMLLAGMVVAALVSVRTLRESAL